MKLAKKAIIFCVMTSMAMGVIGCSNNTQKTSTGGEQSKTVGVDKATEEEEIVTLQVFSSPANASGYQEGWWVDVLREDIGVDLELIPSSPEKLQALMASGSLPDVTIFKDYKSVENAVLGKMLVSFDENKDKLPNVFANAKNSLQYFRDNVSGGTGEAYAVGNRISYEIPTTGTLNWGPLVRQETYNKIGRPKVNTLEDLLPVMKAMQEAEPVNKDGQKIYPLSLWQEWDGLVIQPMENIAAMYGQALCQSFTGFTAIDYVNDKVVPIFEEDGIYMRGLKFLFDANQMGLVDPDSLTQTFQDYTNKASSGKVSFAWWHWATGDFNSLENQEQGIGFQTVFIEDSKMLHQGIAPVGKDWSFAVSNSSKNIDKALEYVDYMYSFDGMMKLMNGPQGIVWDVNDQNEPYITKEGWDILTQNKEMPGKGKLGDGLSIVNSFGLSDLQINPAYNLPLANNAWPPSEWEPAPTKLVQEWRDTYGARDQIGYLSERDMIQVAQFAPMPPVPDELEQLNARIGEVVTTLSWKMIFAKDEAEFEKFKQEMIDKAYGMGVEKSLDWTEKTYREAVELGSKYLDMK